MCVLACCHTNLSTTTMWRLLKVMGDCLLDGSARTGDMAKKVHQIQMSREDKMAKCMQYKYGSTTFRGNYSRDVVKTLQRKLPDIKAEMLAATDVTVHVEVGTNDARRCWPDHTADQTKAVCKMAQELRRGEGKVYLWGLVEGVK